MLRYAGNNSNILLDDKKHVVVVSGDNAVQATKYADTLGTTSLSDALLVVADTTQSMNQRAKALGDIILVGFILSGKIQFEQPMFYGLLTDAITKDFDKLPHIDTINTSVTDLFNRIEDLASEGIVGQDPSRLDKELDRILAKMSKEKELITGTTQDSSFPLSSSPATPGHPLLCLPSSSYSSDDPCAPLLVLPIIFVIVPVNFIKSSVIT